VDETARAGDSARAAGPDGLGGDRHLDRPRSARRSGERFVELRRLDSAGPDVVEAAGYLGSAGYRTYAGPQRFVGRDGRVYRVKSRAQEGNGAELIANRLASFLGIAPATTILSIGPTALPKDHTLDALAGLRVAAEEIESALNNEELLAFGVQLLPGHVDWPSWALLVCFQTWLHVKDQQAIIRMTDGKCFSVDHGNCFGDLRNGAPSLVVPPLAGVAGVPVPLDIVDQALSIIESVTEPAILTMSANVPDEPGWRMPIERRLAVAEFLIKRQQRVREAVVTWIPRLT
jgi:hypothetical protein